MKVDYPENHKEFIIKHSQLMKDGFFNITGKKLLDEPLNKPDFAGKLFHAPFALVSHNAAIDPVFNYGNLTALTLFEFSWEEFVLLPSRLSAEPINQLERSRLLEQAANNGYIQDYHGIRISKSGQRFWIKNAIVWNLLDNNGQLKGQAACFRNWEFIK